MDCHDAGGGVSAGLFAANRRRETKDLTDIAEFAFVAASADAFAVGAHAAESAFIHVDAEWSDGRLGESVVTDALIRAGNVFAATVEADAGILRTFVHVLRSNETQKNLSTWRKHRQGGHRRLLGL